MADMGDDAVRASVSSSAHSDFLAAITSDTVPPEVVAGGPEAVALWHRESPVRLLCRSVLLRVARLSPAQIIALDDLIQSQHGDLA
jgi:hypothetical protein